MRPFNLEEAKAGKPVCTRHGVPVRIICFDKKGAYPIVFLIQLAGSQEEYVNVCYSDGNQFYKGSEQHSLDLFMAPVLVEKWINIYPNAERVALHNTKEEAIAHRVEGCIDTIKIQWQE